MNHDEYLENFFSELERLQPAEDVGLSHAIAYEHGRMYVLVGMGDARAKVHIQKLDPDPIRMAAAVMEMWNSSINGNLVLD